MKRTLRFIGFVISVLAVCVWAIDSNSDEKSKTSGSSDSEVVAKPKLPTPNADISGAKWKLKSWSEKSIDPSKFTITAEFKDDEVSGQSAVNRYFGPFKVKADGTVFVGNLGSTLMAGPDDAMQAETLYYQIMQNVRKYAVDGKKLILYNEKGDEVLSFEKY